MCMISVDRLLKMARQDAAFRELSRYGDDWDEYIAARVPEKREDERYKGKANDAHD